MKEHQVSHTLQYSCFFMDLYEDKVLLPNQKESTRIYIEHSGAAAVLPLTPDNKVLLIKQFRYPIRSITIEIPAGKKDEPTESGVACVTRELEEETGYQAQKFEKFLDIHNCLGYSDELIELFFAYDIYPVEHPIEADDDEFIELMICDRAQVQELLQNNIITDAKTIIMLQEYLRRFER